MTLREMDRRVTQGVRQTVDVALVKVNIVIAAMMMIFSILEIYTDFNNGNPPISKSWPVIYDCNNTRAMVQNHDLILNIFDR